MALYMRYLVTDLQEVTLSVLDDALCAADSAHRIDAVGTLRYGEGTYGRLELGRIGDPFFEEEMADLRAALADIDEDLPALKTVKRVMRDALMLVVLRTVWEKRDTEPTLERIRPLWAWLQSHRTGLLQIDDEGYYTPGGLLLEVK